MDLIFDILRLRNFIDHTEGLKPFNQAAIEFSDWMIKIVFRPGSSPHSGEVCVIGCTWIWLRISGLIHGVDFHT